MLDEPPLTASTEATTDFMERSLDCRSTWDRGRRDKGHLKPHVGASNRVREASESLWKATCPSPGGHPPRVFVDGGDGGAAVRAATGPPSCIIGRWLP